MAIDWQPIETCPKIEDKQYLLGAHGWGVHIAEWYVSNIVEDGCWMQHLSGEFYGLGIRPFKPTHWAEVEAP